MRYRKIIPIKNQATNLIRGTASLVHVDEKQNIVLQSKKNQAVSFYKEGDRLHLLAVQHNNDQTLLKQAAENYNAAIKTLNEINSVQNNTKKAKK